MASYQVLLPEGECLALTFAPEPVAEGTSGDTVEISASTAELLAALGEEEPGSVSEPAARSKMFGTLSCPDGSRVLRDGLEIDLDEALERVAAGVRHALRCYLERALPTLPPAR